MHICISRDDEAELVKEGKGKKTEERGSVTCSDLKLPFSSTNTDYTQSIAISNRKPRKHPL